MTIYQQLHVHVTGTDKPLMRATPDNSCTRLAAAKNKGSFVTHNHQHGKLTTFRVVALLGEVPSRTDATSASRDDTKLVSVSSATILAETLGSYPDSWFFSWFVELEAAEVGKGRRQCQSGLTGATVACKGVFSRMRMCPPVDKGCSGLRVYDLADGWWILGRPLGVWSGGSPNGWAKCVAPRFPFGVF
jgi:hypothetical protein